MFLFHFVQLDLIVSHESIFQRWNLLEKKFCYVLKICWYFESISIEILRNIAPCFELYCYKHVTPPSLRRGKMPEFLIGAGFMCIM